MSTAAPALGRIKIVIDSVNRATSLTVIDGSPNRNIPDQEWRAIPGSNWHRTTAPRGQIVSLKPRKFGEAGRHFLKVARPVEWLIDEPDVD